LVGKIFLFAAILTGAVLAQDATHTESNIPRKPLQLSSPLTDKNFYLLSLFEKTGALHDALLADHSLSQVAEQRHAAELSGGSSPHQSAAFYSGPFLWTDTQTAAVADALRVLCRTNRDVGAFVHGPLRQSGAYEALESSSDEELLAQAWMEAAAGMNNIISTYGLGKAPRYSAIDSVAYDVESEPYRELLHDMAWTVDSQGGNRTLFFEPSLQFALLLLTVNGHDEAVRYEPLDSGENARALQHLPSIDWPRYTYSVILVPGIGPELPDVPLSPMGKMHVAAAARQYRAGAAPFILLSGGFVHPRHTQFSEAIEMKKSLMHDFGIPEEAILVDPQARHTTTNLRNAARQIYRYNLPFTKPALITGDLYQSWYIESAGFAERCMRELGYKPFLTLRRVSPIDLEWLPNIRSLQLDPMDPLDP
jgi:hypothetical protein